MLASPASPGEKLGKSDVCKHIEGAEMLALGEDHTDDE